MKIKAISIVMIAVIILSFIIALCSYPLLPEKIASHWNSKGEVDDEMSKFWGLFLMPLISVLIYLLFLAIPRIDPLKKNIKKFRKYYDGLILAILLFLFYIFLLTIFWNFGYEYNMNIMLFPALGILFFYLGFIMKNLKRNWFVGIRTPWTISNEKVWNKTHKLGGKLFELCGIVMIIGIFFEKYVLWFILIPIIITVVWVFLYSYLEYRKIKK